MLIPVFLFVFCFAFSHFFAVAALKDCRASLAPVAAAADVAAEAADAVAVAAAPWRRPWARRWDAAPLVMRRMKTASLEERRRRIRSRRMRRRRRRWRLAAVARLRLLPEAARSPPDPPETKGQTDSFKGSLTPMEPVLDYNCSLCFKTKIKK